MAGGLSLSVTLSPTWRSASGAFARPPVGDSLDAALFRLGQTAAYRLANASPVRTGRLRSGWRATLVPTQHVMRVTDEAPYAGYVAYGTSRQQPNAALQQVLRELPDAARVELQQAGRDVVTALKGG